MPVSSFKYILRFALYKTVQECIQLIMRLPQEFKRLPKGLERLPHGFVRLLTKNNAASVLLLGSLEPRPSQPTWTSQGHFTLMAPTNNITGE